VHDTFVHAISATTELRSPECEAAMPTLAQRPCIPCRGGVEPLTREQYARYLAEVSDWELDATARSIRRRFQFRDYRTALAFANAVSVLAEEVWHHPELALGWGFCDVSLTTRKIGGLHESDFVMAARIDALASGPLDSAWLPPLPPPKRTKQ
jgi:4a-hydroxytetrahydrobiopterin dehydratase